MTPPPSGHSRANPQPHGGSRLTSMSVALPHRKRQPGSMSVALPSPETPTRIHVSRPFLTGNANPDPCQAPIPTPNRDSRPCGSSSEVGKSISPACRSASVVMNVDFTAELKAFRTKRWRFAARWRRWGTNVVRFVDVGGWIRVERPVVVDGMNQGCTTQRRAFFSSAGRRRSSPHPLAALFFAAAFFVAFGSGGQGRNSTFFSPTNTIIPAFNSRSPPSSNGSSV